MKIEKKYVTAVREVMEELIIIDGVEITEDFLIKNNLIYFGIGGGGFFDIGKPYLIKDSKGIEKRYTEDEFEKYFNTLKK